MRAASSALREPDDDKAIASAVMSEDWEYADSDTQHLTHNIHRYSGKFIPQIARRAIDLLSKPGELVLDPYCGSGTVLVEAALMDRQGIGIDLNPLAVLIAGTKITPISDTALAYLKDRMEARINALGTERDLPLFSASSGNDLERLDADADPRLTDDWYRKWFRKEILKDLVHIETALQKIEDFNLRKVGLVAFSDILRKSSNAHSGYPNVMFDKNAGRRQQPGRPFLKSLARVCDMVASLSRVHTNNWHRVCAKLGDATALDLQSNSVDAVISHPPYVGSIPYAEYGALSLKWLGHDSKDLDRRLTGGRRQSPDVVERFENNYGRMILEAYRVLRPGRHAFLMVGNPVVRREVIDLAEMTIRLADIAGFRLLARTERKGVNRRANKMGAEHLLFFQKSAA